MALKRQHSLVVGGTSGIGRVTVARLLKRGHAVSVIARRNPSSPEQHIARVDYWNADVANPHALSDVVPDIIRRNGKISSLVFFQRFRGNDDIWHGELETSLTGTKDLIDLTEPEFATVGSSVVIVSSINSYLITEDLPVGYHVAKAGLNQLVRYYAVALGKRGIRVNSVSPGTVLKAESKAFFLENKKLWNLYRKMIPLGRMGTADEVAETVLFLCSRKSSFITGQNIVIDGGLSLLWQEALVRKLLSPQEND